MKETPCLWIRRLSIIKLSILFKLNQYNPKQNMSRFLKRNCHAKPKISIEMQN